jgi:hypothetical protein
MTYKSITPSFCGHHLVMLGHVSDGLWYASTSNHDEVSLITTWQGLHHMSSFVTISEVCMLAKNLPACNGHKQPGAEVLLKCKLSTT